MKKRKIEKFPYSTSDLSQAEAKKNFTNFCRKYGPLTLRMGFFVLMSYSASAAFAADSPVSPVNPVNLSNPTSPAQGARPVGPSGNQCSPSPRPTLTTLTTLNIKLATKELVGIAAVGLVCAAASIIPVNVVGIAASVFTIAAKAFNKL